VVRIEKHEFDTARSQVPKIEEVGEVIGRAYVKPRIFYATTALKSELLGRET